MLRKFIAVFLLFAGVSGATDDCDKSYREVCDGSKALKLLPETEEEFDSFCDGTQPFYDCAVEHGRRCEKYDSDIFKENVAIKSGLKAICAKGSPLNKDIVSNLSCLKKSFIDLLNCENNLTEYTANDLLTALTKHGIRITAIDPIDTETCMSTLFDLSWWVVEAGRKCGENAKNVLSEGLQKFTVFTFSKCTLDVVENFPAVVRVFEQEDKERKFLWC